MMPLYVALLGAQTFDLRARPSARPIVFNTIEDRIESKTRNVFGTRFEVVSKGAGSIELAVGPFTSQGRTFGRRKVKSLRLTPQGILAGDSMGRPPFLLSVPLPGHLVKVGDAWAGAIVGPTPMPAGVKGKFTATGPAKIGGVPCLRIGMKIDTELSGARITGSGNFAVRLDDGFVQSGSASFLLVYHRPDPVSHKSVEFARVTVRGTIARG